MSTRPPNPEITAIRQIAISVADVERSVAFYRDALGLAFLFSAGPNLAFLDVGGIRLMLTAPEGEFRPGSSSIIYFKVADITASYDVMKRRGVPFIDEPHLLAPMPDHDLWMTVFPDPDGHTLALMCERPKAN